MYSDIILQSKDLKQDAITELIEVIKELCNKKDQTLYFLINIYQYLIDKVFDYLDDNQLYKFYSILYGLLVCNLSFSKEFLYIIKSIETNDYILVKGNLKGITNIESFMGLVISKKTHKKLSMNSDCELKPNDINHSLQISQYANTSNDLTNQTHRNVKDTITSTNRSFNINRSNRGKTFIPNKNLPFITINFSALLSVNQIIDLIRRAFLNTDFMNVYSSIENDIMVFQFKESNCIKACWLNMRAKCGLISTSMLLHQIRIRIASNNVTNKTQYEHFLEFRCVNGNQSFLEKKISSVIKYISVQMLSISICKRSSKWNFNIEEAISTFISEKSLNCKFNKDYNKLIEEEGSIIELANAEASNYYEIYRILSQENYDVGKNIAGFVALFKEENKGLIESSSKIPSQMKQIICVIDDCISTFNNYFNYARDKKMTYVHPAVDKYIFNKVYFILYSLYSERYKNDNEIFIATKTKINERKSIDAVMDYLEIKPKYRSKEEKEYTGYIPYKPSIDSINKIEYEQSPMEKLETLMKASLELRNTILALTKGKGELESMDDELPLVIYITTQVTITNLPAELHMIEDYIIYTRSIINKETKVLTNLFSSIFYITNNSWND